MTIKDFNVQDLNQYLLTEKRKFNMEIGDKLKQKRKEKKITLNELSLKTITSSTYISQLEKGEYSISLFKFIAFCNALNINIVEFLDEFIITGRENEDLLYEILQTNKNLSKNILSYIKLKKCF